MGLQYFPWPWVRDSEQVVIYYTGPIGNYLKLLNTFLWATESSPASKYCTEWRKIQKYGKNSVYSVIEYFLSCTPHQLSFHHIIRMWELKVLNGLRNNMFMSIFQWITVHLLFILSGHCYFTEFISHLDKNIFAVITQITVAKFVSKANINPWILKIMPRSI